MGIDLKFLFLEVIFLFVFRNKFSLSTLRNYRHIAFPLENYFSSQNVKICIGWGVLLHYAAFFIGSSLILFSKIFLPIFFKL